MDQGADPPQLASAMASQTPLRVMHHLLDAVRGVGWCSPVTMGRTHSPRLDLRSVAAVPKTLAEVFASHCPGSFSITP